ncbi:MAG TPA: MFS transporter [Baekduia sp.]|nr:MFS transporter [Baekduia sp.]
MTPLRGLGLRVYLPTFLFFVGDGAVLPVIALAARDLGASAALAGLAVALRSLGVLAFDLPAGWIIARFGERLAVAWATVGFAITLVGWMVTGSFAVFALLAFVHGSGWSVWQLARMDYVSSTVPADLRGRALSLLGGVARVGLFAGPFAGAALTAAFGFDAVYALALALSIVAAALLFRFSSAHEGRAGVKRPASLRRIATTHADALKLTGTAALAIQALRAARLAIVPLWAQHIGLSAVTTSILFGVTLGVEVVCVYPGGSMMDRWGRKAVTVPALVLMSLGLALLPLTHDAWAMAAVGVVLGLGNGISSGVNMTLGADLAPAEGRAEFLGIWRVFGDVGTAGGPLVVAAVTASFALGGASIVVAALGLAAAGFVSVMVPETDPRRRVG